MKTYKLIYGYFVQIWVRTGPNKTTQVEFSGGSKSPIVVHGTYRTADKAIQTGIESHPWYGKRFILAPEKGVKNVVVNHNVAIGTPTTRNLLLSMQEIPVPEPEPIPEQETKPTLAKVVTGVTNGQEAKRWLYENRQVPISTLRNNEVILKAASEQLVTFPDWTA
jgi:hypothetical protein